jgi:hypothetical protein
MKGEDNNEMQYKQCSLVSCKPTNLFILLIYESVYATGIIFPTVCDIQY